MISFNNNIYKDLLIGLPRMRVKPFQTRLELEKLKHFVAELTVDVRLVLKKINIFKHNVINKI